MKICSSCNDNKEEVEFYKKGKNRLHSWCRKCFSNNRKGKHNTKDILKLRAVRRKALQEFLIKYLLENPCIKCGHSNVVSLQFDHRNRISKKYDISKIIANTLSKQTLTEEMNKCDVLCANCHAEKTAHENDNFKTKPWAVSLIEESIDLRNQQMKV